jgi:hypothetical protein
MAFEQLMAESMKKKDKKEEKKHGKDKATTSGYWHKKEGEPDHQQQPTARSEP